MKKIIYYIGIYLSILMVFSNCQENKYQVGDIIAPTNLSVTVEIVGQDATDPDLLYGDGSAEVIFTATSDNEINYQFDFGDGMKGVSPTGVIKHAFTKQVGVHTYTVTINATGTGGVGSSTSVAVTVYNSFRDEEAENFLSGSSIGDQKTWYWAADQVVHVGLGPVEDDYGNGEFAYEAWWNAIQPFDEEKACMYDNEFVFTRTVDGITFEQTVGPAYVPGAYASVLGITGEMCYGDDVATTMFGLKNVSFAPSSSKAALEGSYNEKEYRKTSFTISDDGFMGWFVGASTYDIISISDTEMHVRIIQTAGDGFAWYHKFTTTKPVEGGSSFTNLVWEDDFNTDGAPDAAKWTYDLGAGGWGNGESQTYTNDAANVKVEGGSLKITAKKDGTSYTSARVKSQGLYKFKYGKVEVRAKLPASQGTWPAIWMLGSNFPSVGWPHCGEIDIMEQKGGDKNTILGTVHWFESSTSANASNGSTVAIADATSEFHVYSLEWTEASIKIFVDDVKYFETANTANLPFNDDFFLILNVAMGGTLGGTIDSAFTEDTMEIDYVKVYQE